MCKKISGLLLVLLVCCGLVATAHAQTAAYARLGAPNIEQFPSVSAYLDVRDAQGDFVAGLTPGDATVIENGVELPAADLAELRPGVQVVFALNLGNAFAIRDGQGNSRYDYISQTLQAWARTVPANQDDLSLVNQAGVLASHRADPDEWLTALLSSQPDFETAVPSLDVLSRAIDLAADPTPRAGMGRAVVFITPSLDTTSADVLQSLADRAAQTNVRIYLWVIDSQAIYTEDRAALLQGLALQTNGQLFFFSGSETFPDPNTWLETLRRVYQISYDSQVTASGTQQVAVMVQQTDVEVLSSIQTYDLQLQPPNPIFLDLPTEIGRAAPEGSRGLPEDFLPVSKHIEILVEFPDGINRTLTRTALYANGELIAENTQEPFDQFTWDLTTYTADQNVMLKVEAEDQLGLTGQSIEQTVPVIVQQPQLGFRAIMTHYGATIAIAFAGVAGAVLLLVLVLSGRIGPRARGERKQNETIYADPVTRPISVGSDSRPLNDPVTRPAGLGLKTRPRTTYDDPDSKPLKKNGKPADPVTQPVAAVDATAVEAAPNAEESGNFIARLARRFSPTRWTQRKRTEQPVAYLVGLSENGEPRPENVRNIEAKDIYFGSDPGQATIVLEEASIESLHAHLWQNGTNEFYLADQDSVAGTWINYAPVSKEGSKVEHGDLIHIGRMGFRFTKSRPTQTRRPVVIREEQGE
ncbi:MAG: FHA domain-containing protein [Anaerolineales bacterium]|nr:FHA domain-containing protein [Anaerolineales bacterium]